jgi:hypothetical protein
VDVRERVLDMCSMGAVSKDVILCRLVPNGLVTFSFDPVVSSAYALEQ